MPPFILTSGNQRVTNFKTEYIPGFDNPLTTWEIPVPGSGDEGPSDSESKSEEEGDADKKDAKAKSDNGWRNVQWINTAGDGYGAHATTFGDIADKIPSKPSLKRSCDNCGKRPDQNGSGYSVCGKCRVSCYCSRECQTNHWKQHKGLCRTRVKHREMEVEVEAQALRSRRIFVSNAVIRKWYYDNVDIVDYIIVQTLELYKGRADSLWRTHAVVFWIDGGTKGASASSTDLEFDDAQAVSFPDLARRDRLDVAPEFMQLMGAGRKIVLVFLPNGNTDLMGVEAHDLPEEGEWEGMKRDEMWRMHVRMRDMAKGTMGDEEVDSE
ncbi:hypothetical protein FB45DRAFT_273148 [Roridomyces roridus]|uniref:MYND-type domain-containing protein n=1 Tax=Roridomyces roridus TaxID=1738132 RepID=A0AAD7B8N4_9AGAR|nr:hypothetical protein FB45DRAFT_273148 [Roridomyces roridus]